MDWSGLIVLPSFIRTRVSRIANSLSINCLVIIAYWKPSSNNTQNSLPSCKFISSLSSTITLLIL